MITEQIDSCDSTNVNREDANRTTLLAYAAQGGSLQSINRLLELGADPMACNMVR